MNYTELLAIIGNRNFYTKQPSFVADLLPYGVADIAAMESLVSLVASGLIDVGFDNRLWGSDRLHDF
jgi:hypothetical protein